MMDSLGSGILIQELRHLIHLVDLIYAKRPRSRHRPEGIGLGRI